MRYRKLTKRNHPVQIASLTNETTENIRSQAGQTESPIGSTQVVDANCEDTQALLRWEDDGGAGGSER